MSSPLSLPSPPLLIPPQSPSASHDAITPILAENAGLASAAPKTKKRVGWHSPGDGLADSLSTVMPPGFSSHQDQQEPSNVSTPMLQIGQDSGAPDAAELTIALERVLFQKDSHHTCISPDSKGQPHAAHHQQQQHYIDTPPTAQTPNSLRPPRPVLRRNTSYDAPKEREEADLAEKKASQRQVRSITNARQRADRLAQSVGGYYSSANTSTRTSVEIDDATFQPLLDDSDDGDGDDDDDDGTGHSHWLAHANVNSPADPSSHIRRRTPRHYASDTSDNSHHNVAESLVMSHTMKANKLDFFHRHHKSSSSGTSTPVAIQDSQDYVPRPCKYRGGILSSLLRLYQDDRGQQQQQESQATGPATGTGTAGASNPRYPVTSPSPTLSATSSPALSRRPSTADSSYHSRRPSGLFSYHRSQSSTSSLALTELLKSSSMLAAPVTRRVSEQVEYKIKKDRQNNVKPKKEQHRITVHIAGILARHRYLMKLCRALMMYGAPSHRLEEYMTMSARVLEIESQFLYLPCCMIISFDDSSTHTTEVKLVRVPQGIDLGKLRDVHNIYKHVVHDELGVEEATKQLDDVINRDTKYPIWFRVIMYGVASASVAPFAFQGRFIDLPCAFILGCIVGLLQLVFAPSNELYAHVFEVTASIITSFLARGFGSIKNGELFCFSALAQSSIALILPGYIVLCGSLELQSHNLVAGSVRMVYALIYTLFLGYGITIGATIYGMMDSNAASQTSCKNPLPRPWHMLFVACFTLCLCIVNQAKWRQVPAMLVMAVAGYAANSYTSLYFRSSGQISNMLGALTVGILANLYSRLGRHADTLWLDFGDWWTKNVTRRLFVSRNNSSSTWTNGSLSADAESGMGGDTIDKEKEKSRRKAGYSLAAAAMLPAIFVQVPSGLAAGGSLLASITSANEATGNSTKSPVDGSSTGFGKMDNTAFNVLFLVIQVAISISVGLFMSALIVYPLGKRRSGLFSF